LEPVYPILYLDALVVKVKDNHQVRNKAAHIAVGVDTDGIKHVLGIWGANRRGREVWAGVLAELRNRGVRDVLIACCDGLTGFPEAIEATWPHTVVQTCVVHLIRASMRFISYGDRKPVAAALRPIYTAPTEAAARRGPHAWRQVRAGGGGSVRRAAPPFHDLVTIDPEDLDPRMMIIRRVPGRPSRSPRS
jgi:putative transposase